jgi:CubicO group peptidase (beta-lactamase class C family)
MMRTLRFAWFRTIVAVVLLSLLAAACSALPGACARNCGATETRSGARALDTAALDDYIARLMPEYDIPGLGLAVVRDGKIAYTRGYGVRDTTTGTPVTPDTQFAIASVTKSFTSLGVMPLVQRGKVTLDKPLTTYIPEFRLSDPAATAKLTVRHILSHASGLGRNEAATFDPTLTPADLLRIIAAAPLNSQPGERFEYSNLNTTMAGVLIERVTGQRWDDYTREQILTPLGMTATLDVDAMQAPRTSPGPTNSTCSQAISPSRSHRSETRRRPAPSTPARPTWRATSSSRSVTAP